VSSSRFPREPGAATSPYLAGRLVILRRHRDDALVPVVRRPARQLRAPGSFRGQGLRTGLTFAVVGASPAGVVVR
ncbi:MAG TPA: hypothetical protein VFD73_21425, partial [Gemmatimonadales bacterium]|nr:hypothetical protein [Gemmatimonadales bacterium]